MAVVVIGGEEPAGEDQYGSSTSVEGVPRHRPAPLSNSVGIPGDGGETSADLPLEGDPPMTDGRSPLSGDSTWLCLIVEFIGGWLG
jgi:hypothetical protein